MNRVQHLASRLCPGGVEFLPLGEVLSNLDSQRRPVTRSARAAGVYPYYGANGVQDYVDSYLFDGTFLLMGEDGSVVNSDGSPVLNWAAGKIWVNNHAHVLTTRSKRIDLRFAYHYLQTTNISEHVTGSAQPKLNQGSMNRIPIPLPPLEAQREIVRILDNFTALEEELGQKLEAEQEARHRQYAHYRRDLIHRCDAPTATLAELGQWHGGVTPSKSNQRFWDGGTIPWLASMDVSSSQGREIRGKVTQAALDETPLKVIPGPSVAVVMRSNILRRSLPVGLIRPDVTVNQDIRILAPHIGVDAEYVYQALQAAREDIRTTCVRTDGSMAAVNSKAFLEFAISLPELSTQRQVAADLRHFDVIVTDLNAGLPAELAARRKQYEYYRDRLLTFEEAPS